jgi:nucleotide-binding universal stress UspA family protein
LTAWWLRLSGAELRDVKERVMKILLAVDGSAYSDFAMAELIKRPWPPDSEIKVITVAEMPVTVGMGQWAILPDDLLGLEKSVNKAAQQVLDNALLKLSTIEDKTLKFSSELVQGPPGKAIVEEAERWGADLILMGSRGLGAWNRLLLGSVSTAVVHHAKCSVEVVRIPQPKKPDE